MSASPTKPARIRLHARISPQTSKRLREHCAARGISSRAGLEAAITEYLDDIGDPTLLMRRLDRLGRAIARTQRDTEIFMESFMVFAKLWFAHTPPVAEEHKRAAQASAEARYKQFVTYVNDLLSRGHRAFDDFPREPIADLQELAAIVGLEPPPGSPAGGTKRNA
jgi:hypothetical protein